MRTIALAALSLLAAAAAPAHADEPPVITIGVGEERVLGGLNPICDDPGVAWISADGKGVLHGVKEGSTLCSVGRGREIGVRQVYRVVVKGGEPGKGPPAKRGE